MDDLKVPPEIRSALDALDARARKRALGVDAERVAARVVERLRSGETPVRSGWQVRGLSRGLRVAASVALLVVAGTITSQLVNRGPSTVGAQLPLFGTDSLTATQADSLVEFLDDVRALNSVVPSASATVGVDELSAQELRALLQAMQTPKGET